MSEHAAKAKTILHNIAPVEMTDPVTCNWLAVAQVHATLALVEQQRIANLIALEASLEPHDYDLRARIGAQVAKGLGIS